MDDLTYASASQIAAAIKEKRLSPREAVEFFIDRMEMRSPSLNAVVFKGHDDPRRAAMFEQLRPWQHTYEKCKSRTL